MERGFPLRLEVKQNQSKPKETSKLIMQSEKLGVLEGRDTK